MKTFASGRSPTTCFIKLKPKEALAEASFSISCSDARSAGKEERLYSASVTMRAETIFETLAVISYSIPFRRDLLKIKQYMIPTQ